MTSLLHNGTFPLPISVIHSYIYSKGNKAYRTRSSLAKQILADWTYEIQTSFEVSNDLSKTFSSSEVAGHYATWSSGKYFLWAGSHRKVELNSQEGDRINVHTSLGRFSKVIPFRSPMFIRWANEERLETLLYIITFMRDALFTKY